MAGMGIVTAGAGQQITHIVKGALFGATVSVAPPDVRRCLLIFTLIQGTHVEIAVAGGGGKIFTLTTDQHQEVWWGRHGALVQLEWLADDPASNWTMHITELILTDAR